MSDVRLKSNCSPFNLPVCWPGRALSAASYNCSQWYCRGMAVPLYARKKKKTKTSTTVREKIKARLGFATLVLL